MATRYFVALIIVLMVGHVADILVHQRDSDDDTGDVIVFPFPGNPGLAEGVAFEVTPTPLSDVADISPTLRARVIAAAQEHGVEATSIGVIFWYSAPLSYRADGPSYCVDVLELGSGKMIGTFARPRSSRQWDWQPAS